MEVETFLLPLSIPRPVTIARAGYHGLPALYTWDALCIQEGLIAGWAGQGTFDFVEAKVYVELKKVLFHGYGSGQRDLFKLRKAQIAPIKVGASSGIP